MLWHTWPSVSVCPYLTSFHPILQDGGGFLLPSSVFSATIRQTGCFCNRREAAMEAYEARLAEFRDEKRSYLY